MSKKIIVIAGILAATTAFALSQREARIAKERMSRCSYNDAVCVGQVMVDALAADNNGGGRPSPYPGGRDKVVVIYGQSDSCSSGIKATILLTPGRLQNALDQCNSLSGFSWSVAIDGVCQNIQDGDAKTICSNTVISANANN